MKNPLYIGLSGLAGSGKDTVAKALRLMLSYSWESFEQFKMTWQTAAFKYQYATFGMTTEDDVCFCTAFADQLKYICAAMFQIPVERFYFNKESGWIAINDNFEYTEHRPYDGDIITADEYYYEVNSSSNPFGSRKWMSLREILVYVGTYVCQLSINKNTFLNCVSNSVKGVQARNKNLKYVICTDVRFIHEIEYIRKNHGINIYISRSDVKALQNVAEHDLDDLDIEEDFDFHIHNDGTYDELLQNLWDLIHSNVIFENDCIELDTRDENSNNYLRKIDDGKYMCCFDYSFRVAHDGENIVMIDPSGGPMISIGQYLPKVGQIAKIEHQNGTYILSTIVES